MDTFSALSVPTRRSILEILATNGELSATEIGRHFSISSPAISQHLRVLIESGLLTVEKHAQWRIYSINPKKVSEVQHWAENTVDLWEQRLDTLGRVLENSIDKTNGTHRSQNAK
jgi:DNA-binding transcriptional ArsR family regulator